jgi:hypothetical protein
MTQPVASFDKITHPRRTVIDEAGNVFHIEFRGSLTSVTVTLPNGIRARGNARLYDGDVYSKEFGQTLATVRASQRALKKYERWLSREGFRTANLW